MTGFPWPRQSKKRGSRNRANVVLRDEAQSEFDDAFDYYDSQRVGLGGDFVARVQQVFDRISANPYLYSVALGDVRMAAVTRFPYRVFYRADALRVEVIAVFHNSRDPPYLAR